MSNLGLGVMIRMLGSNAKSVEAYSNALNKTIREVKLDGDVLSFDFTDDTHLYVQDEGQSCCEHRYLNDDGCDFPYYSGAVFLGIDLGENEDITSGDEESHQQQFINVRTDRGVFSLSAHVDHNGYYGGFSIECSA
jgi:hypothetical protein